MIFGTDVILTEQGFLQFSNRISYPKDPVIFNLKDTIPVLYHRIKPSEEAIYYTYQGVCYKDDGALFNEHNLRFDLLVIKPGQIGKEYIKTIGQLHPLKNTGKETFPVYYEVLSGEAIFLLQRNRRDNEVEEIMAIEAKNGDKVYIPSGYGHIIINPASEYLVVANLIEANFSPINEPFMEKSGAAYFYIKGDSGKGDWIKNPNYKNSVGLKIKAAPNLEQPLAETTGKSLYNAFIDEPGFFGFLTD